MKCPRCGNVFEGNFCSNCGFARSQEGGKSSNASKDSTPANCFRCENCGAVVPTSLASCPACGKSRYATGVVWSSTAEKKKKNTGSTILGVILGVILVIVGVSVLGKKAAPTVAPAVEEAVDYLTADKTEILEKYADVTIGKFTVSEGDFFDECKLPVTVKNKDTKQRSFSIQIEAVDQSGNRLDDDYIFVNDLNPGQSQSFDLFTLVTSDEMTKYKSASFRIVDIVLI